MTTTVQQPGPAGGPLPALRLIDCDIHQAVKSDQDLFPYLPRQYAEYITDFGSMAPAVGYTNMPCKGTRGDLWVDDTTVPGTDPALVVRQHLDPFGIDVAVLTGGPYGMAVAPMVDYAAAYLRAFNDYTRDVWCGADRRFRASVHVAPADPWQAAAEIEARATDERFVQVMLPAGTRMPYGNRLYHPIYEAAERAGFPVCVHFGGEGAGFAAPPTAAGFPSYYLEMRMARPQIAMAHVVSLICEGVFERFPGLQVLFIEHDTFWVPGLMWHMDADWKAVRDYTPWVKRPPSEYIRQHIRFGTQPMEEPPAPQDLATLLAWMHADEILVYASDFPHWDWDDPTMVLPKLPEATRQRIFADNARALYARRGL
ncbi:MAG: amidohydrolase family protein [Chloroflexi bacterium]|nr:amidohydrolase family protein [Chloroflexota bacterium]